MSPAPTTRSGAGIAVTTTVVLGVLTAAGPVSLDTYLPALPALAADLATTPSIAQLSLTSCLLGLALGQLLAGPASDVLGRRRPMIAGTVGFVLASLACALAPTVEVLIACRFAQGLTGAVGIVLARAVVRDTHEPTQAARAFANLMLVAGAAPILAPVVGGQLLHLTDWRGVFVVLAGFGVLALVGVLVAVPETLPASRRRPGGFAASVASFRVLLADRHVLACVLTSGLVFSSMFAYISGSPFVLQELHGLSPQQFSGVFAVNSVGIVASVQVAGRLAGAGRVAPARLIVLGLVVAGVGSGALVVVALTDLGLLALLAAILVMVCGVGLVLPSTTTLALADHPERAGAASALLGTAQFLVGAGTAPLVGLAGSGSAVPMAVTMAGAIALAAIVFTVLRPRPTGGR